MVLVLGGARSGKSEFAERLAAGLPQPVTYLGTLRPDADPELSGRVAAHRARRPAGWRSEPATADLPAQLRSLPGTVLLDGLGAWLAGLPGMSADGAALCAALTARSGDTVLVSDEVGLGVHPATAAGRRFRDALGALNQQLAAVADRVLLVVAGRALALQRTVG